MVLMFRIYMCVYTCISVHFCHKYCNNQEPKWKGLDSLRRPVRYRSLALDSQKRKFTWPKVAGKIQSHGGFRAPYVEEV